MGRAVEKTPGGQLLGIGGASERAAQQAGRAASAQRGEAVRLQELARRQGRQLIREGRRGARDVLRAAESPQELQALEGALQAQERDLGRQEQLIQSIDPAILESSQQVLRLLRGEESRTLDPVRRQRDRQRQSLVNRLREQLGPGAETSSAGVQALNRFDAETDTLISGAQSQALTQLTQVGGALGQQRAGFESGIRGLAGIGAQFGQRASRLTGAAGAASALRSGGRLSALNARLQAGQAGLATAGAQFTQGLIQARQDQQFARDIFQVGLAGAGAAFGGPAGAQAGAQAGQAANNPDPQVGTF